MSAMKVMAILNATVTTTIMPNTGVMITLVCTIVIMTVVCVILIMKMIQVTGHIVNLMTNMVTVRVLITTVNGTSMMICITHTVVMKMTAIIVNMIPPIGLVIVIPKMSIGKMLMTIVIMMITLLNAMVKTTTITTMMMEIMYTNHTTTMNMVMV